MSRILLWNVHQVVSASVGANLQGAVVTFANFAGEPLTGSLTLSAAPFQAYAGPFYVSGGG